MQECKSLKLKVVKTLNFYNSFKIKYMENFNNPEIMKLLTIFIKLIKKSTCRPVKPYLPESIIFCAFYFSFKARPYKLMLS